MTSFRIRELGTVNYQDSYDIQRALLNCSDSYLLLMEHYPVYTVGKHGDERNFLGDNPDELIQVDRGGDVTFHGPGQIVGYPILNIGRGPENVKRHVNLIEDLLIKVLSDIGVKGAKKIDEFPGVWIERDDDLKKIAAIGVRVSNGRTYHGFALNVNVDLAYYDKIVPCGISDKGVTSLKQEGFDLSVKQVIELIVENAGDFLIGVKGIPIDRVVLDHDLDLGNVSDGSSSKITLKRLSKAKVFQLREIEVNEPKPVQFKKKALFNRDYISLKNQLQDLNLVTVCEEAKCPNISECYSSGTATFMIAGDICTRGCSFCNVKTAKPNVLDVNEPDRVADAILKMGLKHAVITSVARDDLSDGGAEHWVNVINAVRTKCPGVSIEVLIPDYKGNRSSWRDVFDAAPDILNHNVETVPRLQKAVRPSASYGRSLALLAKAHERGLVTKSGIILGLGETKSEVESVIADLASINVSIVTVGQYLRPKQWHQPVIKYYSNDEFEEFKFIGESLGIGHVEASPLTRSSYHAKESFDKTQLSNV